MGMDLLTEFQCKINLFDGCVSFYNDSVFVSLQRTRDNSHIFGHVDHNFKLPTNTEAIMALTLPPHTSPGTYILEPIPTHNYGNYAIARAVVTVTPNYKRVNCRLANLTDRPVSFRRNTAIACLQRVDDDELTTFNCHDSNYNTNMHCNFDVFSADQATLNIALAEMGIDLSKSVACPTDLLRLSRLIVSYSDVFAKDMSQLGKTTAYSHKIDTGDNPPQRSRMYRYSPEQKEEIERQVSEMLKNDLIVPSNSLWQSSVVLCTKRNNPVPRFAVDFRKLNAVSKELQQTMISMDDVVDAIGSAKPKVFTVLDFYSGFFQIPLADKESMDRCSFVVPSGIYSFKVLPQGVRNGSIVFQSMINSLFRKMLFRYMLCYTDDVIVYSPDMETHITQHLPAIFDVLRKANLKLHSKKSQFATDSCKYLGNIITTEGCKPDPDRLTAIANYPMCTDVNSLRRFLGMLNYFRKYIFNFSKISHCLTRLLQKDAKWVWTDEHTEAFNTLRDKLISAPILAYPDFSKQMHITTDASTVAISYYLSYFDDQNNERVVSYQGRNLKNWEKSWNICEIEGLAIVESIRYFSVYLSNKFIIHCDNISMKWLDKIKNSNGRLLRWSLLLQSYNFEVVHRTSKQNPVCDALSRRTYPETTEPPILHGPIDEDEIMHIDVSDNSTNGGEVDQTTPSRELIQLTIRYKTDNRTNTHPLNDDDNENHKTVADTVCHLITDRPDLSKLQRECPELSLIINYLESNTLPDDDRQARQVVIESDRYLIENNILYHLFTPRRYENTNSLPIKQVAVPITMRALVLRSMHDTNFGASHPGLDRTYKNLQARFYWKNSWTDVYKYVSSCEECQASKRSPHLRKAPLLPIAPNQLFERIHMDYVKISNFKPDANGDVPPNELLVVVDSFSKWVEAIPVKTERAEEAAEVLYREIFCRYGAPKILVSDRGKTYMSKLLSKLCECFEIEQHFTSSYHPMANSVAERTHSSILNSLRTYMSPPNDRNWTKYLPGILAALRAGISTRGSQFSPFYLCFHKEMNLPIQNILSPPANANVNTSECIDDLNQSIELTRKIATDNIMRQQENYKTQYDKNAAYPSFQVGDLVLLFEPKIPRNCQTPKLWQKYKGPYYVEDAHDNFTYSLRHCETHQPHFSRVHANRLKKFVPPSMRLYNAHNTTLSQAKHSSPSNDLNHQTNNNDSNNSQADNTQHLPIARNNDQRPRNQKEWFSVDKLLATRVRNKVREYKVKWSGDFPPSWVRSNDITPALKQEYHINRTQKRKIKRSGR